MYLFYISHHSIKRPFILVVTRIELTSLILPRKELIKMEEKEVVVVVVEEAVIPIKSITSRPSE